MAPGSILQIYGEPDAGKTALALWYCRWWLGDPEAFCAWLPNEKRLEPVNLAWAGIDPTQVLVAPQSPDLPGLEAATALVEQGCPLVVIDSVAGLLDPEGRGLELVLSAGLYPLKRALRKQGGLAIFCNQERQMPGTRVTQPCGNSVALLHAVDYNLRLFSGINLVREGQPIGKRIHFQLFKNGAQPVQPDWTGRYNLFYEHGLRDLKGTSAGE